jgi:hypothetical protein
MPQYRKPPVDRSGRPEGGLPPADSGGFSIESTTMRLKSMKLRRAEIEKQEAERAASGKGDTARLPRADDRPAGRVRHDERGMAVWDWAVATGEFATLSATSALKKLDAVDLKIEETNRAGPKLSLETSGRDKGGGFDPYNQRGSGKRQGEAATRQGITGAKDRDRSAVLDQLQGKKK